MWRFWITTTVIVTARLNIIERYRKAERLGHYIDPLPLDLELPASIQHRLDEYQIKWQNLPASLQKALLWDSGLVLTSGSSTLVQIYTKCNQDLTTIDISRSEVENICEFVKCLPARTESCITDALRHVAHCATLSRNDSSMSYVLWAERKGIVSILPPNPTLYRVNDQLSVIQLRNEGQKCPLKAEFVIPCAVYDEIDQNEWCLPEPMDLMDDWLHTWSLLSFVNEKSH